MLKSRRCLIWGISQWLQLTRKSFGIVLSQLFDESLAASVAKKEKEFLNFCVQYSGKYVQ